MIMSDKYYYQEGAIHNDNKQVMNVTLSGKVDVSALIKGFFAKDATDAEVVETEKENFSEEAEALEDIIFRDALDMPKVKEALSEVLALKDKSGKLIFGQKNLVWKTTGWRRTTRRSSENGWATTSVRISDVERRISMGWTGYTKPTPSANGNLPGLLMSRRLMP